MELGELVEDIEILPPKDAPFLPEAEPMPAPASEPLPVAEPVPMPAHPEPEKAPV